MGFPPYFEDLLALFLPIKAVMILFGVPRCVRVWFGACQGGFRGAQVYFWGVPPDFEDLPRLLVAVRGRGDDQQPVQQIQGEPVGATVGSASDPEGHVEMRGFT